MAVFPFPGRPVEEDGRSRIHGGAKGIGDIFGQDQIGESLPQELPGYPGVLHGLLFNPLLELGQRHRSRAHIPTCSQGGGRPVSAFIGEFIPVSRPTMARGPQNLNEVPLGHEKEKFVQDHEREGRWPPPS